MALLPGQRVVNEAEPALGLGSVERVIDQRSIEIRFAAADTTRIYNMRTAPLRRVILSVGQEAVGRDGTRFKVAEIRRRQNGLLVYRGSSRNGDAAPRLVESELADTLPSSGAIEHLLNAQLSSIHDFELRADGWRVRQRSLSAATRGLVGARVRLLPHQLYIAHKVSRQEVPRVLLADEVGLGKTIEAGLIYCALRALGRADRVLVLVPESLVHQWLAEFYRRFGEMFTVLDEARCEELDESGLTAFQTSPRVICSLDFLVSHRRRLQQALKVAWDLVIVDEAHHLEWSPGAPSRAYEAVQSLGDKANGLLLLTATPMREGYETEFGLLHLVDPDRFHDYNAFEEEQHHMRRVARLAAKLQEHDLSAVDELRGLFPEDEALHADLEALDAKSSVRPILRALVDRHGTGRVLIRNRRDRLHGFPGRDLHPVRLDTPREWQFLYRTLNPYAMTEDDLLAVGSSVLHVRTHHLLDEQSEDLRHPRERESALEAATLAAAWSADPRVEWTVEFLRAHPDEKVVLICSRAATVIALQAAIRGLSAVKTGVFHEGLSVVERDRQAAYFADREGAQVLLCSEIGGEGRNFQFSHQLLLFDLPIHPDVLEQRIGRLDRIGQEQRIQVHALVVADTPSEALLRWHHEGLNSFERPVHGAEQVMRELRDPLLEVLRAYLPSSPNRARRDEMLDMLLERTRASVERVRKAVQESVDVLVDINSFNPERGEQLVREISAVDEDPTLEAYMERVFDRFGVVDEEVDALGQRHVKPGELMFVESFPGLTDESGIGATYSRTLALAREDLDFLSVDHPMVEGALSLLLDQGIGLASACVWTGAPARGVLFQLLFVLEATGPPALELPRYMPITPVVMTLDATGDDASELAAQLGESIGVLRKVEPRSVAAQHGFLQQVLPRLEDQARALLADRVAAAREAALREADSVMREEQSRLLELRRVNPTLPEREVTAHEAKMQATVKALSSAEARLDAIRMVVLEPE